MGKNGKYNLNFIDWDNEFDAVYGGESDSDENVSKIKGMSMEIFKAILNEEKEFDETTTDDFKKEKNDFPFLQEPMS